jgi:hypothetical protein
MTAMTAAQRVRDLSAKLQRNSNQDRDAEKRAGLAEDRAWKALGHPGGTYATTNVERLCKAFEQAKADSTLAETAMKHAIERADRAEKNARASANERLEAISKKLDEALVPRYVPAITGDSILDRIEWLFSPRVTVSWRHGPGLADSKPETWPQFPPFEGDPRDCKLPEAVIANAIAVSELRALVKFVETEAPPLNCGNNSGHAYWGELRKRVVDFALRRIMVIDITGGKQVGGPVKVDPSVFCTRPETLMPIPEFEQELRALLNRKSKERGSNTPDYVLADFLCRCLEAFDRATRERERWHGDRPAKKAPGS